MTSKYCDNCRHEKKYHNKKANECKLCKCKLFIRGPERDVFGNQVR